jgi:hypothetical protein
MNIGVEFSLSIWYRAYIFQELFNIYNGDQRLLGIERADDQGTDTNQVSFLNIESGSGSVVAKKVRETLFAQGWRLLQQWNTISITCEVSPA